jgi:hypothetical protein
MHSFRGVCTHCKSKLLAFQTSFECLCAHLHALAVFIEHAPDHVLLEARKHVLLEACIDQVPVTMHDESVVRDEACNKHLSKHMVPRSSHLFKRMSGVFPTLSTKPLRTPHGAMEQPATRASTPSFRDATLV